MNLPLRAPAVVTATPPLKAALEQQRPLFVRALLFSFISGVLMLVPQWFMFEVYGRVLNSRNQTTLYMLLMLTVGAYIVIEMLDLVRSRILLRAMTMPKDVPSDQEIRDAVDRAVKVFLGGIEAL